ncbi:hypothetical protein ACFPYM_21285, partial [Methylobacterium hispanicum]
PALALALGAARAAAAPVGEPSFPSVGDRFLLSVRGPLDGGRERFARLYASPVRGTDYWTTTVVCGTRDVRSGKERIEMQGAGNAWLNRGKLGGNWSPVGGGGGYGESQMRAWSVTQQDGLNVTVAMSGPCPPLGEGDVSSGD